MRANGRFYFHSKLDLIRSSSHSKRIDLHNLIDEVMDHSFHKHECDRDGIDSNEEYERFWKEIVENEDGSLNLEQIKKELADFSLLIGFVSKVYDTLSNGQVSKPLICPEVVIDVIESEFKKECHE